MELISATTSSVAPHTDKLEDSLVSATQHKKQGTGGGATLADLCDPLTMPAALAKAHAALDRAVDRCYRKQDFPDERRRFEHLFSLYESLIAPLTGSVVGSGTKKRARRHK